MKISKYSWAVTTALAVVFSSGCSQLLTSNYAGQHVRAIKALSASDQRDFLDGKGMGFAKAAELNSYPGPMHTLELAKELALTEDQLTKTRALLAEHKAKVKVLGAQLVEAERSLDVAFATRQITRDTVFKLAKDIGDLHAAIRTEHLATHIEQTEILSTEQVLRYNQLRGY